VKKYGIFILDKNIITNNYYKEIYSELFYGDYSAASKYAKELLSKFNGDNFKVGININLNGK